MKKEDLFNLIIAIYRKQSNTIPEDVAISEIEQYLEEPNCVPELLFFLTSDEIQDDLIKKACLIYLYHGIKINTPTDLTDQIIEWIEQLLSLFQSETDFQYLIFIHQILKFFIKTFYKSEIIASIFFNYWIALYHDGLLYQAILLGKTILKYFNIKQTPELFQMFSDIALQVFQNFPDNFFNSRHDINEVELLLTLILKSRSILKTIYNCRIEEIEEEIGLDNLKFGFSVYFLPISILINILPLGFIVNQLSYNHYHKFWHFMAKSLNEFNRINTVLSNPENSIPLAYVKSAMPANLDFSSEKYQLFEENYFQLAHQIFKSTKFSDYYKSVPFYSISPYLIHFKKERALLQFRCEIFLTYSDVVKNIGQYDSISKYLAGYKQCLTNKNKNPISIYNYFKNIIFPKMLEFSSQNQEYGIITILIYLSTAVKLIPNIISNDLDYISSLILLSFQSESAPLIYSALKVLKSMFKRESLEIFSLFYDFVTNFIPYVQQFILIDEIPISIKSLEIYSMYLNLTDKVDFDFLNENADQIKEISKQHFYQFLSLYFLKADDYESEELISCVSDSISLLDNPFIQMSFVDTNSMFSIFEFVILCLKNNEKFYEEIFPLIEVHFNFFIEEVLSRLIDTSTNSFDYDYFSDNWLYILRMSCTIASFSTYYSSDLSKIYLDQQNFDFFNECLSSIWNLSLFLLQEKNLSFESHYETTLYLKQNIFSFEEYGYSFKLMNDQQIFEYTNQLYEIMTNINDDFYYYNLLHIILLFNYLFPRLIEANDEHINSIIIDVVKQYLQIFNSFFVKVEDNVFSKFPIVIEPLFECLTKYCESCPDNVIARSLLDNVYHLTHESLLSTIDIENIDQVSPFHLVFNTNFSHYNDIIESLVSAPGYEENIFWIDLYIKTCEKYSDDFLYYALDTIIKSVQKKSVPIEIQDRIATFSIDNLNNFFEQPSSKLLLIVQNIIFLFHRLIKNYQNQMILDFVTKNLNEIVNIPQIFKEKSDDDIQYRCLEENIASLCLCLACFNVDLEIDLLSSAIEYFIPTDDSEQENFLNYFLFIQNPDNQSQYLEALRDQIFIALVNLFSKPFCVQVDFKIQQSVKDDAVQLFWAILNDDREKRIEMIEELLHEKQLDLFRIHKFIQFYDSLNQDQNGS